jgi:NAD dependent epimerase/dehydratase
VLILYAMKQVLVTGADGFIGSHLVEALVADGYKVRALSLYNSFNSWGWLEDTDCLGSVEVVSGDIRDPDLCRDLCQGVDTVFHLAALIAIPYSYKAPHSYLDTNVQGTLNMCSAAMAAKVKKFVHTSTSEVYGTAVYAPIDEKHPLQPQSPYSATKIAADHMALSYFYSFELPVVVARPFNTYGPRQSARAVIPTIISQILAGKKEIQLGAVTPVRDFNFVKDTVAAMIAIANIADGAGQTFNIGSGTGVTILETFNLIKNILKSDVKIVEDSARKRPENSEVHKLICNADKLTEKIGKRKLHTLEQGLTQTIEWLSRPDRLQKYKPGIYNL